MVWTVDFEPDGQTVRDTDIKRLTSSDQGIIEQFTRRYSLPEIGDPEDAADITKH